MPAVPAAGTAGPGAFHRSENVVVACLFASTVLLPIVEIGLRAFLHIGIENLANLVQHITLVVGMLGAAVAAREGRLLTLAVAGFLKGRAAMVARTGSAVVAVAVSVLLALAALEFIDVERSAGATLAYGVPVWIVQAAIPLGFAVIAWRLMTTSSASSGVRASVTAAAAALVALVWWSGLPPDAVTVPAIVVMLVATVFGAPVFMAIGGIALVLLMGDGVPAASVALNHYGLVSNPTLPAIPIFTLAGYLLAESRAPNRLLEVFDALFGRLRGGAAIAAVLASTFFTCFTGASGVSILTLGGLVMPLLLAQGMAPRHALGLVTSAGLPGVILMPALPLLLYAIVAGQSIEDMFRAGLLPALLMLVLVSIWGVRAQGRSTAPRAAFSWPRARRALSAAKWELTMPFVPIVLLATSVATPVEAAAFTAAYAGVVVTVIHRDLRIRTDLPRVATECALMIGGILLVLGVAMALTNYLVDAEIPVRVVDWVTSHIESRWVFLLALNVALLLAGCVMDAYTAIVVLVPLVAPLGVALDVHPAHLGIIFLANLEIGYLTPPVGMNLFFSSYRFRHPIGTVFSAILPVLGWLIAALLLITYVPWLSTALLPTAATQ
jgi:C4-dicarboxylate transporter DctM subunit